MCSVVRYNESCTGSIYKGKKCKYHFEGGTMLSPFHYFSRSTNEWTTSKSYSPCFNDLRFEGDTLRFFDGRQWRKQCLLCEKVGRPVYCNQHDPSFEIMNQKRKNCSKIACIFLDSLEKELGTEILHQHIHEDGSIGGQEFSIPGTKYRVDGLIVGSKTVIEILGDFWHGNPELYKPHDLNSTTKTTYGELLNSTFQRFVTLVNLGYKVRYVWEKDILENQQKNKCVDYLLKEWIATE
jgi:G:T-mismatch repair DNA endonuclease (very short patch repair protein)